MNRNASRRAVGLLALLVLAGDLAVVATRQTSPAVGAVTRAFAEPGSASATLAFEAPKGWAAADAVEAAAEFETTRLSWQWSDTGMAYTRSAFGTDLVEVREHDGRRTMRMPVIHDVAALDVDFGELANLLDSKFELGAASRTDRLGVGALLHGSWVEVVGDLDQLADAMNPSTIDSEDFKSELVRSYVGALTADLQGFLSLTEYATTAALGDERYRVRVPMREVLAWLGEVMHESLAELEPPDAGLVFDLETRGGSLSDVHVDLFSLAGIVGEASEDHELPTEGGSLMMDVTFEGFEGEIESPKTAARIDIDAISDAADRVSVFNEDADLGRLDYAVGLELHPTYERGTCLTVGESSRRRTRKVDCSRSHHYELLAKFRLAGTGYDVQRYENGYAAAYQVCFDKAAAAGVADPAAVGLDLLVLVEEEAYYFPESARAACYFGSAAPLTGSVLEGSPSPVVGDRKPIVDLERGDCLSPGSRWWAPAVKVVDCADAHAAQYVGYVDLPTSEIWEMDIAAFERLYAGCDEISDRASVDFDSEWRLEYVFERLRPTTSPSSARLHCFAVALYINPWEGPSEEDYGDVLAV